MPLHPAQALKESPQMQKVMKLKKKLWHIRRTKN